MQPPRVSLILALLVCVALSARCLALAPVPLAGDPWTDLGCAHSGVAGDPLLVGSGTLQLGTLGALDLTSAAPDAAAVLFVGLAPDALSFKGGTLKANPVITVSLVTGPGGTLNLPFLWSTALPEGTELTFQYGIEDVAASKGVALSNAVLATTPLLIPEVDSFGPSTGGLGTVVTITGDGFVEDPIDYCLQVRDPFNNTVGFMRATAATGTTLTGEILAAPSVVASGFLLITPGEGSEFVPSSIPPDVNVVGDVWLWEGDMADTVVAPELFSFDPGGGDDDSSGPCQYHYGFLNTAGNLQIVFPFGGNPCPVNTQFTLQMDIGSSLGTVSLDYNACIENTVPLSAVDCASKVCQLFQQAYFDVSGQFVPCSVSVVGSEVQIIVSPPFGETWNYAGGSLTVCGDDILPCTDDFDIATGTGTLEVQTECPPTGGQVTYYITNNVGILGSGSSALWAFAQFTAPPGLTESMCACEWCDEIVAAVLTQTGATLTCTDVGSGKIELSTLPPTSASSQQVCPNP